MKKKFLVLSIFAFMLLGCYNEKQNTSNFINSNIHTTSDNQISSKTTSSLISETSSIIINDTESVQNSDTSKTTSSAEEISIAQTNSTSELNTEIDIDFPILP